MVNRICQNNRFQWHRMVKHDQLHQKYGQILAQENQQIHFSIQLERFLLKKHRNGCVQTNGRSD